MQRFEFTLTGVTPLLMHADSIPWADHMNEWKNKAKEAKNTPAGDDRHPGYRWIGYMHRDDTAVGIPTDCLTPCAMKAAGSVKMPGARGQKTFKTESVALMGFEQEILPIVTSKGILEWKDVEPMLKVNEFAEHQGFARKHGFDLHVIRATVGTSKHIRVRPKFNQWSVTGTCWIDDDRLAKALQEILDTAGRLVGLGDWRPSSPRKPGRYGRFTASIKEIK